MVAGLALFIAGAAIAQSQLPGKSLTADPANDLRPIWSPDDTQIAFFSSRSGNNDIWVMEANGGNPRQLTIDPADDRRPAWSPDGQYLAFDSDRAESRDIWVIESDGQNLRLLINHPANDSFPAWSPDGRQIAFYRYEQGILDLWVVDLADFLQGGEPAEPQRVTNGLADEKANQCTYACHMPAWSPDGHQIAYASMNHTQIWIIGVDGNDPRPLTDDAMQAHFPRWTPDGKIRFLSEHLNVQQEPVNDVWVIDADGKNATLLFSGIPHGGPLEFKSDGITIAFHSPRSGNFDIYTTVLGQAGPNAIEAQESTPIEPIEPIEPVATEAAVAVAPTAEAIAPAQDTVAPEPAAETPEAPVAAATAGEPASLLGRLGIWAGVILIVGSLSIAFFLARRGRTS